MRPLAPLALLVLLASAQASGASESPFLVDVAVEGEPAVGAPFTMTVGLQAQSDTQARLRLDLPAWIDVEDAAAWTVSLAAGERAERAWRLTATQPGFWRAALVSDAGGAGPIEGCCLFVWSTAGRGIASAEAAAALPAESSVGFHTSLRALDEARAELIVRVSPQDRRYVGQQLVLEVPVGTGEAQRAPADGWHDFAHAFPLRAGESAVLEPTASLRVTFQPGPASGEAVVATQRIACASLRVERAGDDVREVGRTGCKAPRAPSEPALVDAPGRRVPLPGIAPVLALALAVALAYPLAPAPAPAPARAPAAALAKAYPRRPV